MALFLRAASGLLEKSLDSSMDGHGVRHRRNGDSVEKRKAGCARGSVGRVVCREAGSGRRQFGTRRQENFRSPVLPRNSVPTKWPISHLMRSSSWCGSPRSARTFWHDRPLLEANGDAAALSHGACWLSWGHFQEIRRSNCCPAVQSQD